MFWTPRNHVSSHCLKLLQLEDVQGANKLFVGRAGEEEDALKEVGDALQSASQSSEMSVERVSARRGAEAKYRASRKRRGSRS